MQSRMIKTSTIKVKSIKHEETLMRRVIAIIKKNNNNSNNDIDSNDNQNCNLRKPWNL